MTNAAPNVRGTFSLGGQGRFSSTFVNQKLIIGNERDIYYAGTGECHIRGNQVTTFDRTNYDAAMDNGCQYLAVASTEPRNPFALLIDRSHAGENQVKRWFFQPNYVRCTL